VRTRLRKGSIVGGGRRLGNDVSGKREIWNLRPGSVVGRGRGRGGVEGGRGSLPPPSRRSQNQNKIIPHELRDGKSEQVKEKRKQQWPDVPSRRDGAFQKIRKLRHAKKKLNGVIPFNPRGRSLKQKPRSQKSKTRKNADGDTIGWSPTQKKPSNTSAN